MSTADKTIDITQESQQPSTTEAVVQSQPATLPTAERQPSTLDTELIPDSKDVVLQHSDEVQTIAKSIDFNDPSLSISYGAKAMTGIAKFADELLSKVKAKDAGPIGESLSDLMVQVKTLNVENLANDKKSFLEQIPFIGSFFDTAKRTIAQYSTLAEQVEVIGQQLDKAMHGLLLDIEVLDQLYDHNKAFHDELAVSIAAGKKRLEQARTEELPQLQKAAEASSDSMAAQQVRDFAERLNRFERRLHDLQLSRTITLQTAPQIRLIQGNNQTLAEKIQTSVLATIPIWKSQIVLALSLHGQRNAAKLQRKIADTTNDLLQKNADMLATSSVETAREVERSIIDIETLRNVHSKLISTIEETLAIAQEGREKRMSVEQELQTMETDLRNKLTSLTAEKNQASISHAANPQLSGNQQNP